MRKTILEIYALAVCFFTVACFVVVLGIALYDVVQIAAPEFTFNAYQYERYQSNQTFRESPTGGVLYRNEKKELTQEEITQRRKAEYAQALQAEKRNGEQSLLRMCIIMFVDALAFLVHWQIAKGARQSSA